MNISVRYDDGFLTLLLTVILRIIFLSFGTDNMTRSYRPKSIRKQRSFFAPKIRPEPKEKHGKKTPVFLSFRTERRFLKKNVLKSFITDYPL